MPEPENVRCILHKKVHDDMTPACWASIRRLLYKKIPTEPISHRRVYYAPAGR